PVLQQGLPQCDVVGQELIPGVRIRISPPGRERLHHLLMDLCPIRHSEPPVSVILTVSHCTMRIVSDVKPQRLQYVEQTKESLIEAAERLFIAEGYQRTTLDAVGAAARFTKGAVYRHFKDKRSLFEAVFERVAVTTLRDLLDDYEPLD